MSTRLNWEKLKARELGLRSTQRTHDGRVLRALKMLVPAVPIRWTLSQYGEWLVRGPLGLTGDVDVEQRSGGTRRVTIKRLVWSGDGVALYRVRRHG